MANSTFQLVTGHIERQARLDESVMMRAASALAQYLQVPVYPRHFRDMDFQISRLGFKPLKNPETEAKRRSLGRGILMDTTAMMRGTWAEPRARGRLADVRVSSDVAYARDHVEGRRGLPVRNPYQMTNEEVDQAIRLLMDLFGSEMGAR